MRESIRHEQQEKSRRRRSTDEQRRLGKILQNTIAIQMWKGYLTYHT